MTPTPNLRLIFRLTLAVYVLLLLSYIVKVLILGPGPLPETAAAYLNWWAQQLQSQLEQLIGYAGLAASFASIVAAVDMALFAPWARVVFIIAIAVLIGFEPLMDYPVLLTPVEHFFDSVAGVLAGAIIVFSYWTGLTNEFIRHEPNPSINRDPLKRARYF